MHNNQGVFVVFVHKLSLVSAIGYAVNLYGNLEHFISFVIYAWAQKTRLLRYTRLKRLTRNKQSVLLCPFEDVKKL
jgi:hypothetical protein